MSANLRLSDRSITPHQENCLVKPAIVVLVQYLQLMALNLDFDSGDRRALKAPIGYTF
jgi:hypothetical protein